MHLFYHSDIISTDTPQTFDKEESIHINKVLRKKDGDTLHITNGKGDLFQVLILDSQTKSCAFIVQSHVKHPTPKYQVHLAVAPTKMNLRYEWFVEKATEIGVTHITPIICENSERQTIKKKRLEKIAITAMKQSLNYHLPVISDAIPFKSFINQDFNSMNFIAHCNDAHNKNSLKRNLISTDHTIILIGPEGDFSQSEIDVALQKSFIPVSLGQRRLRTETAAIVACHTITLCNETN